MKKIAKLEAKLSALQAQLKSCTDPCQIEELEERIENIQFDIDELEEDEMDRISYEEATGTTAQDLYLERNSYAVKQSEAYDRFKNEY